VANEYEQKELANNTSIGKKNPFKPENALKKIA
jgi:hypothetical protein